MTADRLESMLEDIVAEDILHAPIRLRHDLRGNDVKRVVRMQDQRTHGSITALRNRSDE